MGRIKPKPKLKRVKTGIKKKRSGGSAHKPPKSKKIRGNVIKVRREPPQG